MASYKEGKIEGERESESKREIDREISININANELTKTNGILRCCENTPKPQLK